MIANALIEAARSRLPSTGLWRNADFMNLWAAHAGSAIGSRITRTALPVIAILVIGASPSEVAVLSAMSVAPGVIVGLTAGGIVDRSAKRPIMIAADLARAALLLSLPVAVALDVLTFAHLLLVAALAGALTTLFELADRSFLPALTTKGALLDANAKLESTEAVAEAIGPGLAGVLIQVLTAPIAIVLDALTFVWSAARLKRIAIAETIAPALHGAESLGDNVRLGFATCLRHPILAPVLLAEAGRQFFNGVFFSLYMILALETLQLSPAAVGLIISVGGVGALIGTRLVGPMRRVFGPVRALAAAFLVNAIAVLFVPAALFDGAPAVLLLVLQQAIGDAFLTAYLIYAVSLRQQLLPGEILARANAAFHVVAGTMAFAGVLMTIALADRFGAAPLIWFAAVGGIIAAAPLVFARNPAAQ